MVERKDTIIYDEVSRRSIRVTVSAENIDQIYRQGEQIHKQRPVLHGAPINGGASFDMRITDVWVLDVKGPAYEPPADSE